MRHVKITLRKNEHKNVEQPNPPVRQDRTNTIQAIAASGKLALLAVVQLRLQVLFCYVRGPPSIKEDV
jgi:hypothetical protein